MSARGRGHGRWLETSHRGLPGRVFSLLFFPAVHGLIDFSQQCQLLDKELAGIMTGAAAGRREADKLIEAKWKSRGSDLILVHVEVQAQRDSDFARRDRAEAGH